VLKVTENDLVYAPAGKAQVAPGACSAIFRLSANLSPLAKRCGGPGPTGQSQFSTLMRVSP
jgi:hypothetical protein